MSIFISLLTIFPQVIMVPNLEHFLIIVLLGIFLILVSKTSKILFSIFIIYLNIVNIFQANIAIHWGDYTGDLSPRISTALLSPTYETLEYLREYVDYRDYFVLLYSILTIFILIKFILHYKHTYKTLKTIALGLSIIFLVILQNHEPFKVVKKFIKIDQRIQIIKKRDNFLAKIKHEIKHNNSLLYDKIIVIQGESANKHHLNIYDYNIRTTPYLSSLLKTRKLYRFNAVAAANLTRYAVPMIFTKAHVHNWKNGYTNSQSIITDFKDNNYKTYWISNQARVGKNDEYIANIALESDVHIFFNYDNGLLAKPDIVIIDYLKEKKINSDKEMYVFHLAGSHFKYSRRNIKEISLYKDPKDIVEHYDNSIYLTDYIIKSIVQYFEKNSEKILLVYLSDHGEVVNINSNRHGHGFFSPSYKDEYEVPLVVYSSIENSRIEELFNDNKKHYFNTENLNYFIEYIAGISNDKNTSYSSKVLCVDPKNILDYNQLKFYK